MTNLRGGDREPFPCLPQGNGGDGWLPEHIFFFLPLLLLHVFGSCICTSGNRWGNAFHPFPFFSYLFPLAWKVVMDVVQNPGFPFSL